MRIIDQTNDPGFANLRVLAQRFPELRDMSKTANLSQEEFGNLPDEAFAWPGKRLFPVHNREQAALSLGYRKLAGAVPVDVDSMLEKAAEAYDIDTKVFDKPPVMEKVADDAYLLPEKKRFRVESVQDVKYAEDYLHENYRRIPLEDRAEAFIRLEKVAAQFDVRLDPSTHKLAGFTVTSTQVFKDYMDARREAALPTKLAELYLQLGEAAVSQGPVIDDRLMQTKLAGLVRDLDKKAGVENLYGQALPDPLQAVYNTTVQKKDLMKLGSAMMSRDKMERIPLSFWEDVLGEDVTREIASGGVIDTEKLGQILETLPQDLKVIVQKQLAAYK